jgi:hypothetical protein
MITWQIVSSWQVVFGVSEIVFVRVCVHFFIAHYQAWTPFWFTERGRLNIKTERMIMKKHLIVVIILMGIYLIYAQTPDFQWLTQAGSGDNDYGYDVCTDTSGYVYQTGAFWGTMNVGGQEISSAGNRDLFVIKADSAGNVIWAVSAGGADNETGNAIVVDANGDVYVHGTFKATATFGATTLISGGQEDIYLAKLNGQGVWQWAISASTPSSDVAGKLALDSQGNIYVAGAVWGSATFGTITPTAYNYYDLFVAKANSAGTWLWVQIGGGSGDDKAYDIAVDADSNVYVVGSVMGSATFGTFSFSSNHYDVLVAKLNSSGVYQWISRSSGTSPEYGHSIALDPSGAIYVGGYYYNDGYFAPLFGNISPVELGTQTMFVGRMNSSGTWLWVKGAGALQSPGGGSSQENKVFALAVDTQANLWVTGVYQGTATFDSQQLPFIGGVDGFVGVMDGGGNWTLLESFGSPNTDWSYGISTDTDNNVYLSGSFSTTVSFGDITTTAVYGYDSFLVKYGYPSASDPEISVNPDFLDFGTVWLGDSNTLQITLDSTGSADLVISNISLSGDYSEFSLDLPTMPITINPSTQREFEITFSPSQSISYNDAITITSNAINHPQMVIPISGEGQYSEPAVVQNVVVEISGDNALISWDPVTTSVEGSPLIPDRYIVLYNETPYEDSHYYYFLASTVDNSFTHHEVALFRDQMFYRVVAVKFYREDSRDWLDNISPTEKMTWQRLQQVLR